MIDVNVEHIIKKIKQLNGTTEVKQMHEYVLELKNCGLLKSTDFKLLSEYIAGKQYCNLLERI